MAAREEYPFSQVKPAFLRDENCVPGGMCTMDITSIAVSPMAAGEMTLPLLSLQGNNRTDIPQKKHERVDYPGRSVLYSRQFRPFTQDNQQKMQNPRLDEP